MEDNLLSIPNSSEVLVVLEAKAKREAYKMFKKLIRKLASLSLKAEVSSWSSITGISLGTIQLESIVHKIIRKINPGKDLTLSDYLFANKLADSICSELERLADDPRVIFSFDCGEGDYYNQDECRFSLSFDFDKIRLALVRL